jgi:hypothetical protein
MSEHQDLFAQGFRLQQAGRFREALEPYRAVAKAVVTTNLACNMAYCLSSVGELDEALVWLRLAREHRPDAPTVLETSLKVCGDLLAVGRYAEGWPLMEARIPLHPDVVTPIRVNFPEWKGEPLAGKSILVWVEQGFGDQIMLVRFARRLAEQGARVSIGCRPTLAPLFAEIEALHEVIPIARNQRMEIGRYDYWSRYFSLPLHLGTTLESLPAEPYLRAPADRRARWTGRSGVGVMWRTSPTGFAAGVKTAPDDQAQRLLDRGAVSLQPEHTGVEDFADTAAIIEGLDLVISVDTSVAHLAGAMGKPCWTLLPAVGVDWRWMRDRRDSPWYPSMRLFRQRQPGDWSSVIDDVIAALG